MKPKDYIEANRKAWNQVAPIHEKARFEKLINDFRKPKFSLLDTLETKKLLEIGLKGKSVIQLGCNNGRELLSIKNLGAKRVVGIDISSEFIRQANELKDTSHIEAEFVCSEVYKVPKKYDDSFDIVYISIGVISWMPDVSAFFEVCARLLKKGGTLFIYELHPFVNMIETPEKGADGSPKITMSYFNKKANKEVASLDYYDGSTYESLPQYWFGHRISEVIMAMISHGVMLKIFEEYPYDISYIFKPLEKFKKIPLSYILIGEKI